MFPVAFRKQLSGGSRRRSRRSRWRWSRSKWKPCEDHYKRKKGKANEDTEKRLAQFFSAFFSITVHNLPHSFKRCPHLLLSLRINVNKVSESNECSLTIQPATNKTPRLFLSASLKSVGTKVTLFKCNLLIKNTLSGGFVPLFFKNWTHFCHFNWKYISIIVIFEL